MYSGAAELTSFPFSNPLIREKVFKRALFEYSGNSKFCELLSFEILAHCNSTDNLIRSKAASMFYLFLKMNWQASGNLSRMQVQSTVAVSRLVGGMKDDEVLITLILVKSLSLLIPLRLP